MLIFLINVMKRPLAFILALFLMLSSPSIHLKEYTYFNTSIEYLIFFSYEPADFFIEDSEEEVYIEPLMYESLQEKIDRICESYDIMKKIPEKEIKKPKVVTVSNSYDYEAARQIWNYLKYTLGYNNYVCAGILGNIMAECGGQTLNIKPYTYVGSYYGICMWYTPYAPGVSGAGLQGQLSYLANDIRYQFNNFGSNYYYGFNYNAFINLADCYSTALAFAKCYERCSSASYNVRQRNALKAYNYFVG